MEDDKSLHYTHGFKIGCPYCEITRLKGELENANRGAERNANINRKLTDKNIVLERQIARLKQIAAAKTVERARLADQLAEARAENKRLKDNLSDAYDDHCDSH